MEKLLNALEAKHPGYKVMDVAFSFQEGTSGSKIDPDQIDESLAVSVKNAKEITLGDLEALGKLN